MSIELRPVTSESDWVLFHSILVDVLWVSRGHPASEYSPELMQSGDPAHHPLLVWLGDRAVGAFRLDLDGDTAWMRRVAVLREFQRRGLGSRMVAGAVHRALAFGCSWLRANVDGASVGFYRKV